MRNVLHWAAWGAVLVFALLIFSGNCEAQDRVYITPNVYYTTGRVARAPIAAAQTFVSIGVATTARVPDGGTITLASYSRVSESRTEAGAPLLGKLPVAGRLFRTVGYGREVVSARVTASVRIIDLREEEERQTGYRSR